MTTDATGADAPRAASRPRGAALTRRILAQAWPVLVGQWALLAFGVTDTIVVGHASAQDLAAMALGASIYSSVFVGLMGVVIALTPIIGQHYGAARHEAIGRTYMQGLWLAVWLTVIGVTAMAFPNAWLVMSAVDATVTVERRPLPARADVRVAGRPRLPHRVRAQRRGVASEGHDGDQPRRPRAEDPADVGARPRQPRRAASRRGRMRLRDRVRDVGLVRTRARRAVEGPVLSRRSAFRFAWPRWTEQRELLRLGVPTGLSYIVEVTSFTFMTLLAAGLGTRVTGGHQIAANLAALCFMLPLALSVATSAQVAQAIGANDATGARRASRAGLRLAIGLAVIVSTSLWLGRHEVVALYTNDAAVRTVALSLIGFVAVFHCFDATQSMSGFILRAYKHAVAPMLVYTVSLWGVGLVGGWWIAFHPVVGGAPLGVRGLWTAATASLALAALVLLGWMLRVSRLPLAATPGIRPAGSASGSA